MSIRRKLLLVNVSVFLLAMALIGIALILFWINTGNGVKWYYIAFYALLTLVGAALITAIIGRLTRSAVRVAHELADTIDQCRITGRAGEVPERLTRRNDEAGMLARSVSAMMRRVEGVLMEKEYMAYHDSLTRLKNRYRLKEDVSAMLARQQPFAFVLMDIDDFKRINDAHGHAQGDRLLVDMADVLSEVCADIAEVYRWGGDEFVLLIPGGGEACRAILECVMRQVQSDLHPVQQRIDMSMGVCLSTTTCETYGDLLVAADKALDMAKKKGKGQYVFCEPDAAALSSSIG